MTKRYGLFLGIILLAGLAECVLTPLIALLQETDSFLLFPLYYLSRLLALSVPFFVLGAIFSAWCRSDFHRIWVFFVPMVLADLIVQVPISLFAYFSDLLTSFGIILVGYAITSVLSSLLVLLLALLGYFLFFSKKETLVHHSAFFTLASNEGRAAAVCASSVTLYLLADEILSIIKDAAARLWILDPVDILNYLFSIVFALVCGLACYAAARGGSLLMKE